MNSVQSEKAKAFLELHKKDKPLILPNIWSPLGARILEAKGYPAAATASAAISAMLGYRDGEKIKFSTLIDLLERIVSSVNIPVTADIESGYAASIPELNEIIKQIINTGIVGINLEDSIAEGEVLRNVDEQVSRLSAARETADKVGIHLVINARTDSFLLKSDKSESWRTDEAILRADKYVQAGADCIFTPGARQKETVIKLREAIKVPLNIIATPWAPPLKILEEIGINRISFGPYVFRSVMKKFENIITELQNMGEYECYTKELLTYDEIAAYLRDEKEV